MDVDTHEPRVIELEGPASLQYPVKPGLIKVLASLRRVDRRGREAGADSGIARGRACPGAGGLGRAGSARKNA